MMLGIQNLWFELFILLTFDFPPKALDLDGSRDSGTGAGCARLGTVGHLSYGRKSMDASSPSLARWTTQIWRQVTRNPDCAILDLARFGRILKGSRAAARSVAINSSRRRLSRAFACSKARSNSSSNGPA